MAINTKSSDNQQTYKTVKIDVKTHADLSIYKVKNNLKTLGDAIRELLEKNQGKS